MAVDPVLLALVDPAEVSAPLTASAALALSTMLPVLNVSGAANRTWLALVNWTTRVFGPVPLALAVPSDKAPLVAVSATSSPALALPSVSVAACMATSSPPVALVPESTPRARAATVLLAVSVVNVRSRAASTTRSPAVLLAEPIVIEPSAAPGSRSTFETVTDPPAVTEPRSIAPLWNASPPGWLASALRITPPAALTVPMAMPPLLAGVPAITFTPPPPNVVTLASLVAPPLVTLTSPVALNVGEVGVPATRPDKPLTSVPAASLMPWPVPVVVTEESRMAPPLLAMSALAASVASVALPVVVVVAVTAPPARTVSLAALTVSYVTLCAAVSTMADCRPAAVPALSVAPARLIAPAVAMIDSPRPPSPPLSEVSCSAALPVPTLPVRLVIETAPAALCVAGERPARASVTSLTASMR